MPINGVENRKFGVYRSLCCGEEIVISEGVAFPDCPNHPNLPTKWKAVDDDIIRHVTYYFPKKTTDSTA